MDTGIYERKKVCPVCKVEFSCYTEGCWCNELPNIIPMNPLEQCLCPGCLKKAIDYRMEERNKA